MRPLFTILAVIITLKLGEQLFRYFAYADERAELAVLREQLVDAGAEVVRTRIRADSMREGIEQTDRTLEAGRRSVGRYGRHARDGALPGHLYGAYRNDLHRYNTQVSERNERLHTYNALVDRNQAATDRYNRLADSLHALAARIGDPYYPIPKPIEAAAERGLVRLPP